MKLSDVFRGFWLDQERQYSPHTVKAYKSMLDAFLTFAGDVDVSSVTRMQVREFLNEQSRLYADATVVLRFVVLKKVLTWAADELEVDNPTLKIATPRIREQKEVLPLTEIEVRNVVSALSYFHRGYNGRQVRVDRRTAVRDLAMVAVLLDVGLRAAELCNLDVRNYTPDTGRIHVVKGKGAKDRTVFLGKNARFRVWRYLATREGADMDQPLFVRHHSGKRLEQKDLYSILVQAGERAGVGNVHTHRFRHTFAVNFLRNGADVLTLQRMMGHSDIKMLQKYVKLAEVDVEASQRTASVADKWGI